MRHEEQLLEEAKVIGFAWSDSTFIRVVCSQKDIKISVVELLLKICERHHQPCKLVAAGTCISGAGGLIKFSPTQYTQRPSPEGRFYLTAIIPEIDSTVDTLK